MVRIRTATILFLVISCCAVLSVHAEDNDTTDFRIQDYIPERFTDFEWRLNGEVGIEQDKREHLPYLSDGTEYYESHNGDDFELSIAHAWKFAYQTRQVLFESEWSLDTYLGLSSLSSNIRSSDTDSYLYQNYEDGSSRSGKVGLAVQANLRRYLLGAIHIAGILEAGYTYDQQRSDFERNYYRQEHRVDPAVTVSREEGRISWARIVDRRIDLAGEIVLGVGRRYDGRHAVTALQMVDELKRHGVLHRRPGRETMLELTALIHHLREGHGPDAREYRISALEAIIEYLTTNGITEDRDAALLLTIEDVWDFFPSGLRRFGWEIRAGFGGVDEYYHEQREASRLSWQVLTWDYPDTSSMNDSVAFSRTKSRFSRGDRDWYPSDYWALRAGWWKPLSARWQFDAEAWIKFHLTENGHYASNVSTENWRTANTQASIRYVHDGRTEMSAIAFLDYERLAWRIHFAGRPNHDRQQRFWTLGMNWRIEHRIAVPTSLVVDLSYVRESRWYTDHRSPGGDEYLTKSFGLSVGVTHWLF